MAVTENVAERAQQRVGTVLRDKWRLDGVLGIGGMAAVYSATHRNQSRVAIKMLHPEVAIDAEVTARFLREGYVANTVGHPGTVSVLDDDLAPDGAPFLVMEMLEGETVDARWARRGERMTAEEALTIVDRLLDVLASAHARGIVHRDLKPENLFITIDGRLKVLDFGIARLREVSAPESTTKAGSLLGTPAFMAPEQARGRWDDVDHRTDLWAVGATLYSLLSGHFVHEAGTVNEQLIAAATVPAKSIAEWVPDLPADVVHLIDRALAFDKADRWESATAMRNALRATGSLEADEVASVLPPPSVVVRGEAPTVAAPSERNPSLPRSDTVTTTRALTTNSVAEPRGLGRAWAAVAAVALLAALGGVFWLQRGSSAAPAASAEVHSALPPAPVARASATAEPEVVPGPPAMAPAASAVASAAPATPTPTPKSGHVKVATPGTAQVGVATAAPPPTTASLVHTAAPATGTANPFDRRH